MRESDSEFLILSDSKSIISSIILLSILYYIGCRDELVRIGNKESLLAIILESWIFSSIVLFTTVLDILLLSFSLLLEK